MPSSSSRVEIPRKLPVLLVTDGVVFPSTTVKVPVRSNQNIQLVEECLMNMASLRSAVVAVAYKKPQRKDRNESVLESDFVSGFHRFGTAAIVTQVIGTNWPRPSYTLQLTGLCRIQYERIIQKQPILIAAVTQLDNIPGQAVSRDEATKEHSAFLEDVQKFVQLLSPANTAVAQLRRVLRTAPVGVIADVCAAMVDEISYVERLEILDTLDVKSRVQMVQALIKKQIQKFDDLANPDDSYSVEIYPETVRTDDLSKIIGGILNGNLLRKPLGSPPPLQNSSRGGNSSSSAQLLQKLKDAKMPEAVEKQVMEEYSKLKGMTSFSPEYTSLRNYIELMADLPWSKQTNDTLDVKKSRQDMDADHYALEDVKKRVLEYLAVRQLRNSLKGPILCFVGPPGVGKTSIAKSIAKTLGRQFHRISLGGISDQSDIRGHRRTYVASMPGRIIQGLKTAQSRNPVFLLDEVDKLSAGIHGDPAAALLEVLDPEQNSNFVDHYVNAPFDLSQVLFVATANTTSTIPSALLDRMEVIGIPGYTQEEKTVIASSHLIPKQLQEHGLTDEHVHVSEATLKLICQRYTREAGVRSLERRIAAVFRAVALRVAELKTSASSSASEAADPVSQVKSTQSVKLSDLPIVIGESALEDILGPAIYTTLGAELLSQPGVAAGLAWTPTGGEVLYVEATRMEGEGKLTLTGQLGGVMQESARVALNWLRSHSVELGLKDASGKAALDLLADTDVHIHFPAGAVGKDGPSAGITVLAALASLFTGRCLRSDTAMTGEITLRGLLLPVGGVKDKILAAHRAGFQRVVLPNRNEKDLADVPPDVKKDLKIILAERVEDVLQEVFEGQMQSSSNVSGKKSKI